MILDATDHGSVWLFDPADDDAKEWIAETAPDDAMYHGTALAVEANCVDGFAAAFENAGGIINFQA